MLVNLLFETKYNIVKLSFDLWIDHCDVFFVNKQNDAKTSSARFFLFNRAHKLFFVFIIPEQLFVAVRQPEFVG